MGNREAEHARLELTFKQAAARFKSLDPQQCLSCGEPEVRRSEAYGNNGVHVRHGPTVDANKERIMGDGSLHRTPGKSPYGHSK